LSLVSIIFILLVALFGQTSAQELDTISLQKITVIAGNDRDGDYGRQFASPEALSIIRPEEYPHAFSVIDLLEGQSGVQVEKSGGYGSFSTASIRGQKGQQVRVYIDNVPLNSANGTIVDLGKTPLHNVQYIEIFKGNVPARFGGSGSGGVIHIVTRKQGKQGSIRGSHKIASYTTQNHSLAVSGTVPKMSWNVSAGYDGAKNNFKYLDRNGTPYNPDDDVVRERSNDAYKNISLQGRVNTGWNNAFFMDADFQRSKKGIPGRENEVTFTAGNAKPVSITLNTGFQNLYLHRLPQLQLSVLLPLKYQVENVYYPRAELSHSTNDTVNQDFTSRAADPSLELSWSPVPEARIGLHTRASYEIIDNEDRTQNGNPLYFKNSRKAVISSLEAHLGLGKVLNFYMQSGLEWDHDFYYGGTDEHATRREPFNRTEYYPAHRLGGTVSVSKSVNLYANAGRYYRAPTLIELFGDRGHTLGNDTLKAEYSYQGDFGLRFMTQANENFPAWYFDIGPFFTRSYNTIVFVRSVSQSKPQNIDGAFITGLESNHYFPITGFLHLENHSTFQFTGNRSELYGTDNYYGKELPNEPKWDITQSCIVLPVTDLRLEYTFRFQDENFVDLYNTPARKLGRRFLHSVRMKWQVFKSLECSLFFENISDQIYWDPMGYPQPGRMIGAGMNYQLNLF
jgi:outer membrane cobalamin receptor